MCDKCRALFAAGADQFIGQEFDQRDDPEEVVENFTNTALGCLYSRLAKPGIEEVDAKALHDKVMKCIEDMNTRAMLGRHGIDDAPAVFN